MRGSIVKKGNKWYIVVEHIPLQELRPIHLEKFFNSLLDEKKLSKSTVLKIYRILSQNLKPRCKIEGY